MLKTFKPLLLFTFLVSLVFSVNAQITTYPYNEDFEAASPLQANISSCDVAVNGASISGWTQDPNDDGEWRADTAGTGSIGTGPGASSTSSGVGVGTDVNPGTTGGIYLYTEATSANTCSGSEINLISPAFDFSASSTYYRLKINYHMFGAGMGSLHIDVFDGKNWNNDIWTITGNQDTLWHSQYVNLANFNGDSNHIRIRSIMGASLTSDLAIDDITVETYTPDNYDLVLRSSNFVDFEYPIIRYRQLDSVEFEAICQE